MATLWLAAITRYMKRFCAVTLVGLGLSACTGFPEHRDERSTTTSAPPETTFLSQALVSSEEAALGRSGFTFLECGLSAYLARLALIEAATRTVDVQYYRSWNDSGQSFRKLSYVAQ